MGSGSNVHLVHKAPAVCFWFASFVCYPEMGTSPQSPQHWLGNEVVRVLLSGTTAEGCLPVTVGAGAVKVRIPSTGSVSKGHRPLDQSGGLEVRGPPPGSTRRAASW